MLQCLDQYIVYIEHLVGMTWISITPTHIQP